MMPFGFLDKIILWARKFVFQVGKEIKLFDYYEKVCQYEDKKVHAEVICSGKVGKMKSPLMHYTFKSIAHYMEKWDRYSTWSAQDHLKSRPPHFFHFILKPAFRFFRDFILRGGFWMEKRVISYVNFPAWEYLCAM